MKRLVIIFVAIVGFSCCLQSTTFAAINKDFEKLLLEGDSESAKNNLKILYKNKDIDSDELLGLLDLIDSGALQSIASFESLSEKYISTKDNDIYVKLKSEFNKITQAVDKRKKMISRGLKYLSSDFVANFNSKIDATNKKMAIVTTIYNDEVEKQREVQFNKDLEDNVRKEKLEKRTELEKQRKKLAEKTYREAIEWAENNIEYRKSEINCEICQAITNKKEYEEAIKKEKLYSNKYGVVNLSRIEDYKVGIIASDNLIKEGSAEYRKLTNTKFNFSACGKTSINCEESLENIKQKLVARYLAEHQAGSSKLTD